MTVLVFVFGLAIGSFLNALIHRLHAGVSIWERSSRCPKCGHRLKWRDLIPVMSFLILGRRCRYCHRPISWQYPSVELITGIVFLLFYLKLSVINYQLLVFWIFACFLIVIFVYDWKHYLILDKVVFPAAVMALIYQIISGRFAHALWGSLILSGFFGLLYLVSRGKWIGAGDIKLGIFLGFLIPYPEVIIVFFLAYFLGAIVSVWLLSAGKKHLGDKLPFGTFLTLAAFIAMLYGQELITWYFGLIGIR